MSKNNSLKPILRKKKSNKLLKSDLLVVVLDFLKRRRTNSYSARQLIKELKLANNKDSVSHVLEILASEKKIINIEGTNKYSITNKPNIDAANQEVGIVDLTKTGDAYVVVSKDSNDIFVRYSNLNTALNGDKVKVKLLPEGRRSRTKKEGVVIKIIERSTEYFIGTIQIKRKRAKLIPDSTKFYEDIEIPLDSLKNAKDEDKAIVKITSWGEKNKLKPTGVVTLVLGKSDSNELEMNSILIQKGFNISFSETIMKEAKSISNKITDSEIANRRDFRNTTTFTIDPFDAKDFDDALSIKFLKNKQIEVGIHIADVSHYLKVGTEMDKEAYLRSTSVYLVDRCNPMLPEILSNELCSLRPNEDKLTFSAVFTFDENNILINKWFGKTVIHSNRRFSYEEAQLILDTEKGDFAKELLKLNEIALKLRKKRFRNGAINFESDEIGFKLDSNKKPIAVFVKERGDSNKLIEEFMLLANKEVAKFIDKKEKGGEKIPFVYRIHDYPNEDKINDLSSFTRDFGFTMNTKDIAKSFNQLMKEAEKNDALKPIIALAIRTMAKAEYSTDNIGHYGLAFEHYSHFTSPIRRYSDVLTHRILEKNLNATFRTNLSTLEAQCKHISQQERKAMECERESIRYKQTEFLENKIGATFPAIINGMNEKGFFAEIIENKCEGMVRFETMRENFILDPSKLKAKGMNSNTIFKIGDKVNIKIISVDMKQKRADFELED